MVKRRLYLWRLRWARVDPRRKLLVWAAGIAALVGLLDAGAPLEIMLMSARNANFPRQASGQIVVVGIDDKSFQAFGQWPWPRRYDGMLVDRLRTLGAKQVFFDFNFRMPTNDVDDSAFESALARAKGKVTLPVRMEYDGRLGNSQEIGPMRRFSRWTSLASIYIWRNFMGQVLTLPYESHFKTGPRPAMAARLADLSRPGDQSFPIDYAISTDRVPFVSAVDILQGKTSARTIVGKQVIIGTTGESIGDMFVFPGQGPTPGVYVHVLGAETLLRGTPRSLGWLAPLLFGLIVSAWYVFARRRLVGLAVLSFGTAALLIGPLVLELFQVFAKVVPAMIAVATIACVREWALFRTKLHLRGTTNIVSGLPNLVALRELDIDVGCALAVARVQNFADITSSLPPEAEQQVVEQVAARLKLGGAANVYQGDEGVFAWIVPETDTAVLGERLNALHTLFRSPLGIAGRHVDVSVNFGVDTNNDRLTANRLSSALVAASEAADEGRRWRAYDPQRLDDAEWKLSLLGELDAAIDNGGLWVAYQPQLDLTSNTITGAEALVRWTHPTRGAIPPDQFIATAEQHNRIDKLTRLVLDESLRTVGEMKARHLPFGIAVNLSTRLLDGPWIVQTVETLLSKYGLPASCLTLEITESAAIVDNQIAMSMLEQLHAIGVSISIDDYGTGMSTLDYLRSIPASEIKIDRGFVSLIDRSASDRVMVSSTIQLAHSLGRTVVAEGVESTAILTELVAMGCDSAQGFLIGHPMPQQEILRMLLLERRQSVAK